jgi:hypothetical protein
MRQVIEDLKQAAKTTAAAGEALKEAEVLLTQRASAMDQALSFSNPFIEMAVPSGKGSKEKVAIGIAL